MDECSFLSAYMDILHRIAAEAIETEDKEQYATEYLQIEFVLVVGDEIHYETHTEACKQGIYYIADSGTYTCYETVFASFVQGSLNA